MSAEDLPKRVLLERLLLDKGSGLLKTWSALVSTHPFPPLLTMVSNGKSKDSFKAAARKSMLIGQYIALVDSCSNLPISSLPAHMGKPSSLWLCSMKDRSLHGSSNFRIRLLTGCDGLELDASRFRSRNRFNAAQGDATCKLCHLDVESSSHFLSGCFALSPLRDAGAFLEIEAGGCRRQRCPCAQRAAEIYAPALIKPRVCCVAQSLPMLIAHAQLGVVMTCNKEPAFPM